MNVYRNFIIITMLTIITIIIIITLLFQTTRHFNSITRFTKKTLPRRCTCVRSSPWLISLLWVAEQLFLHVSTVHFIRTYVRALSRIIEIYHRSFFLFKKKLFVYFIQKKIICILYFTLQCWYITENNII